jgi:UMF1 family MFS transporter
VTYGLVSWLSSGDHRLAILMTATFFVAGLGLLFTVNIQQGRAVALANDTGEPGISGRQTHG